MFNDRATIYWTSFALLVFFSPVVYVGYSVYKGAEESAYKSCVLSMKDALIETIKHDETARRAIEIRQEWRTLNGSEARLLVNASRQSKSFDCKNYPASKTGEGVQIAIRQIDGRIEMELQINGRIEPFLE